MKNKSKNYYKLFNIRPFNCELKEVFIARFCRNFDVRAFLKTNLEKLIAANKIWEEAKKESIVSIKITNEEYYIFY